ncbi:hypothetical protein [Candidatus Neptunichlamydia sp. REUL1]|uniref:hypothetical protein n=1 Tax=Candidatus Neptunichlamydia sp. REUL1 TaxID=3064277 RepID=UPI0029308B78|nr:hypothetical protein [Candidatus Neptunochlamydia sp. REUL1]
MDIEIDLPRRMLFDWKKLLVYIVPAALLAGLLITKVGTRKGGSEGEYIAATHAFVKWDQILDQNAEEFASLQRVMKKHPELHAHYDALIGQNLLSAHSPKEAEPYIGRTLKRTDQPYYSDYARTSLLISAAKYEEARQSASLLKQQMLEDTAFWKDRNDNSALFAFNLLRIATLSEQLGDLEGEQTAWKELKHYGGWEKDAKADEKIGHAGFKQLLSHFTVQETSLLDYIASREEDLSKQ